MEGTVIAGRYTLQKLLGQGAMSEVWLAHDARDDRSVAVKLIDRTLADDADARRRFAGEAEIVARLPDAYVAPILDEGVEGGRAYWVMEHLRGETLRARLQREGCVPITETAEILADLCVALDHVHAAGIVHRDLKPENVFLVAHAPARLLDFGVAKARSADVRPRATGTGDLLGTVVYMSPEQAQGLKTIDSRADLWALGVIVFECITGVRPFSASSIGRVVAQILGGPIPVPSRVAPEALVTPAVDAWMARALTRDPAARFGTAGELGAAFAAAIADEPRSMRRDELAIRRAIAAGDVRSAFGAALAQFGPEIRHFLGGHLGREDLADDAFSHFSERLWSSLARFEWKCSFRTWAFVIARRAAADVRDGEGRRERERTPLTETHAARVAEAVRTATLPLLKTAARSAIARLRDDLPAEDKMLLILRVDRGLAWDELARVALAVENPADDDLRRESARLRKRFQLVKTRLRERAKAEGLLER